MEFNLDEQQENDAFPQDEPGVNENTRDIIKRKLRDNFNGKIVRKDLTKKIKEGANVPVYVLEFLLGQYCSSDDDEIVENGIQSVKRILSDNFVRPDEAQKILSKLRSHGSHTVIDSITVRLDIKNDIYVGRISPIWDSPVYPLPMNTRKNMTDCSAVAFGASFSWIMSLSKKKRRTAIPCKSGN